MDYFITALLVYCWLAIQYGGRSSVTASDDYYFQISYINSTIDINITAETLSGRSVIECSSQCSLLGRPSFYYNTTADNGCYCNNDRDSQITEVPNKESLLVYGEMASSPSNQQGAAVANPSDCYEIYNAGNTVDGEYTIQPPGVNATQVWCDMANGGWTVIQRRMDGSETFNRVWNEYIEGFGNATGEYWLGLEAIHQLSSATKTTLRIDMETFSNQPFGPDVAYAEYADFSLTNSSTNYQLQLVGFTGDCGDSFSPHNGFEFTTHDADHDSTVLNCAQVFLGGWWYDSCHTALLNGAYINGGTTLSSVGLQWPACWGHEYSLRKTVMKIRPT